MQNLEHFPHFRHNSPWIVEDNLSLQLSAIKEATFFTEIILNSTKLTYKKNFASDVIPQGTIGLEVEYIQEQKRWNIC